ncbi:MAG: NAD(P)H-binding protein [Kineosporiaceae bacterium]|nr:NAD(P)H-binding protein [Aeromicrobium sp.]
MRIVIAGASGFIGSQLSPEVERRGHDVVAMTRRPDDYTGAGEPVYGDVHDPQTLPDALKDCDAAFYLVHSLSSPNFERLDADAALSFGQAAADVGIKRIVYLGGLGDDSSTLSKHLRSRREVEGLLGAGGVPVTTLRAGIIVGSGGLSWEITRQLVAHLPVMVTPRWVRTKTQPIALEDTVHYLASVMDEPDTAGRTFDIGGPEVLSYLDMMKQVADAQNRPLVVLPVPVLTPGLSSRWLSLVTDVDTQAGRALIDSMTTEVVVTDDSIREMIPFEPMTFRDAVRAALLAREQAQSERR